MINHSNEDSEEDEEEGDGGRAKYVSNVTIFFSGFISGRLSVLSYHLAFPNSHIYFAKNIPYKDINMSPILPLFTSSSEFFGGLCTVSERLLRFIFTLDGALGILDTVSL